MAGVPSPAPHALFSTTFTTDDVPHINEMVANIEGSITPPTRKYVYTHALGLWDLILSGHTTGYSDSRNVSRWS
jgi:hypothetical protein